MSTYSPNIPDKGSSPVADEIEILNLRPLLNTYSNWWREIILLTLLVIVIGSGIFIHRQAQLPILYEATARVAITRIYSNVVLDSAFQTTLDNRVSSFPDTVARRTSLIGLIKSGTIAQAVLDELSPQLGVITVSQLISKISSISDGGQNNDLIEITATDTSPELAAAIANTWAKHYVRHINILYSEIPTEMAELVSVELEKAYDHYIETQQAYEDFLRQDDNKTLMRQIQEKEQLVSTLRSIAQTALQAAISQTVNYRQEIISTYQAAMQQNQLLAINSEQNANRNLVQKLIQAINENRQLALDTEQQARVQIFKQYAERELQNRLLAMQQEQDAKTQIFQAYSEADLQAKLAVFNQQAQSKMDDLLTLYGTQRRVEQLLDDAQALQIQIEQAGEAGASSNALPLLLLKLEAYAATATDSGTGMANILQVNLAGENNLEVDITNQAADILVLIDNLATRATTLQEEIEQQSLALFNNEGYALLDGVRPEDDALYAAIQQQYLALFDVDGLSLVGNGVGDDNVLSQAITDKYDELFGIGALTTASLTISDTTPMYVALKKQYPALFAVGDLTQLAEILATDSALDSAGQQKLLELLQPTTDLDIYLNAIDSNTQPIQQLEEELRGLQAELENKRARNEQLMQERNTALEAYTSLNNKLLELSLERTAAGREVGLASTATPPDYPIPNPGFPTIGAKLGLGGFFFASLIAFLATYMNIQPFFSRSKHVGAVPANQVSR